MLFLLLCCTAFTATATQVTPVGALAIPRKDHTATVLADGRVLILGGQSAAGELASAEIYDPVTRTFLPAGAMSVPRVRHAATLLPGGKVFITGGRNALGALATAEVFDPAGGFRAVPALMRAARQHHTSTLLSTGKVLLAGGDLTGTAELYDPATDTFSTSLIAMVAPRSGQTATTLPENSVLLAGGGARSVEVFDVQTSAFLSWTAALTESRTLHSAINAADGSIYFVGGEALGTLEKFNLLSGSGASFPLGARSSAATALANGKILVTGPTLAALFNPVNGSLSPLAEAGLLQRSGQTVTELSGDKQILMVGGTDVASSYVGLAALYNPARIVTDKPDYYPDEPVIVYGFGWKPGETVELYVVDNIGWVFDSAVTADADGQFTADPYFVVLWQHLGVAFDLTAVGGQSGLRANHTFTDAPRIGSLTVGAQNGTAVYGTSSSVTFSANPVRAGNGTVNAVYSITFSGGTPPGVTAGLPPNFTANGGSAFPAGTLTLTTSVTTPAGTYPFTLRVAQGSDDAEGSGVLVVSAKPLTISGAAAVGKTYDGTTAAMVNFTGASLAGVVGSDNVTINSAGYSATFADKNVGANKPVSVTGLALGGSQAANYTLSALTGLTADITPLGVTGAFTADNKVYDGNVSAVVLTRSLSGVLAADAGTVSLTGGAATFADGNVGNGKTVTLAGATLSGASAGNYNLTSVTTATANITALGVTGSFTANNKVYDGNTTASVASRLLSGVIAPDVVELSGGTATFDTKQAGNGKTVTLTGASLSGPQAANYSLTAVAASTADITPRSLTVGATGINRVYDGTTSAAVTLTDDRVTGDVLTANYAAAAFADKHVGVGKPVNVTGITLEGADAGNYTFNATATTNASITPRTLSVSATGVDKVYDGNTSAGVNLTDDRVSGDALTVSYTTASFVDKQAGTGKTVNVSGISVTGDDAGNYSANASTSTTANITPRVLNISAAGSSKIYDATTAAAVTLTDDRISGDVFSVSFTSASFADKNVGSGKVISVIGIGISGTDAGNYTFNTVASATASITPLAISGSFTAANKAYDATTDAAITGRTLAGVLGSDVVSYVGGTASFSDKNAGIAKTVTGTGFSLSGADAANYTVNASSTATADITPRAITGSVIVADKVYDGTVAATITNRSLSGVLGSDVVTYAGGTATFGDKQVGTAKSVTVSGLSLEGADAANYTVPATANTTASITPRALTVTATGINKPYDGTTNATVTLADDRVSGDVLSITYGSAVFNNENVGTAKPISVTGIAVSGADAGNYTFNPSASAAADILPRLLTVTATGVNRVYDGTVDASVTLTTDNVPGDEITASYVAASFADKNVGLGKTVNVTGIAIGGADIGNYTLAATTAVTTANITARALNVTATASSRVYNGTTSVTVTLSDNRVAGDVLSTSYSSASFDDKNVGTNKTVFVSGITIAGTDAGNYVANTSTTATASILPLHITGTFTADNKVYDGTVAATVLTRSTVGDVGGVSLAGGSATFSDKNVGVGKVVTLIGASLSGPDAGNYVLDSVATTTATISPLHITGAFTASGKVYDGTTDATVLTRSTVGDVGGVVLVNGTASFADKNVGAAKVVTLTGATLGGVDALNYVLDSVAPTTAGITPRTLVVSATGINRAYDGSANAQVTLSDDRVSGDALTTAYANAAFSDKHVGTAKSISVSGITVSGVDSSNYTFNPTATATADITRAILGITAVAADKVYDGNPSATVTLSDNRIAGDNLTLAHTTATFADKHVGTNKTVTVTGITLTGTDAGNYTFAPTTTTVAKITARALLVSAIGASRVYNGTAVATVTFSDDRLSGDVFAVNYGSALFNDKNVGTNKPIQVSGITLSGPDAGNYAPNASAVTSANITVLAITGNITASHKTYDGTVAAQIASRTLSGQVAGDDVSYVGGTAVFNNKHVGTGKPVSGMGLSLSGADAGNYTVNATAATVANITALGITGSITASDKVYDGTTAATILTRSLSGVIAGDVVSYIGGTATFDTKDVGTGKTVTAVGLSLSGADAGNYSVNTTALTSANITPAAALIEISGLVKAYTGGDLQPTVTVTAVPAVPASAIQVRYNSGNPDVWTTTLPRAVDVYGVDVQILDPNFYAPTASALFVIYDPTAGHVTGGGWIHSPVGASTQFPDAVGKANFGFNAKYQKGASKPTGQTEFQFQAGNLNFKSTSYEWLVVQGTSRAQFKGTGTINGSGSYTFLLTALDGDNQGSSQPDAFRIKITGPNGVVYDNKMNSPETGDDATVLGNGGQGGGSIVIHDPKK